MVSPTKLCRFLGCGEVRGHSPDVNASDYLAEREGVLMKDRDDDTNETLDLSPVDELKQIALMYHVVGNYEKADEIMGVVRDLETKRAARLSRRRDSAA